MHEQNNFLNRRNTRTVHDCRRKGNTRQNGFAQDNYRRQHQLLNSGQYIDSKHLLDPKYHTLFSNTLLDYHQVTANWFFSVPRIRGK